MFLFSATVKSPSMLSDKVMVVSSSSFAFFKAFVSSSAVPTVSVLFRVVSVLCSSTGVVEVKGTILVTSFPASVSSPSVVVPVPVSPAFCAVVSSLASITLPCVFSSASAVTGAAVTAIATARDREIIFPVRFFR